MRKKGYTLVELLAVFVLIAVIATLALAGISKYSNGFKNISDEQVEQLIKSSAKTYVYNRRNIKESIRNDDGKPYPIYLSDLKEKGYFSDKLKDLKTYEDKDIDMACVCVTYSNNRYNFDITQPCECN